MLQRNTDGYFFADIDIFLLRLSRFVIPAATQHDAYPHRAQVPYRDILLCRQECTPTAFDDVFGLGAKSRRGLCLEAAAATVRSTPDH
jgi:hypothetical protein